MFVLQAPGCSLPLSVTNTLQITRLVPDPDKHLLDVSQYLCDTSSKCLLLLFHDLKFSEKEDAVPPWAFKLNNALAAAQTWHLNAKMLKVISIGDQ